MEEIELPALEKTECEKMKTSLLKTFLSTSLCENSDARKKLKKLIIERPPTR